MSIDPNRILLAWSERGMFHVRYSLTGKDVIRIHDHRARDDGSGSSEISGFLILASPANEEERAEFGPMKMARFDTLEEARAEADNEVLLQGYGLIDRDPSLLPDAPRRAAPWRYTPCCGDLEEEGLVREWVAGIPAAYVTAMYKGWICYAPTLGNAMDLDGVRFPSLRAACLAADEMLARNGWEVEGVATHAMLDGTDSPVPVEWFDRTARGDLLVRVGTFGWAAQLVSYCIPVRRAGWEAGRVWDMDDPFDPSPAPEFVPTSDDLRASDWELAPTESAPEHAQAGPENRPS